MYTNKTLKTIFVSSLLFLSIFSAPVEGFAQNQTEEELLENQVETSDEAELLELLESLRQNPINLNSATEKELVQIPFILPNFAKLIFKHREKIGQFNTLDQLKEIPNLPTDLPETIRPYVTFVDPKSSRRFPLKIYTRTRFKRKIEKAAEYSDGTYFNSPEKFYQRFRIQASESINLGLLLEKDSGEKNYRDYQSFFLSLNNLPLNSQLILGDFSFKSGLGLIFWGPYGNGLSASPISSSRLGYQAFKPFQSVAENAALRGMAWQTNTAKLSSQLFYSRRNIDATVDEAGRVISRYTTGLHRTETEIAKKDRLEEQIFGASLLWEPVSDLTVGGTFAEYRYSQPFIRSDLLRKRFAFAGTRNQLTSLSVNYIRGQLSFFGEAARSRNQKYAVSTGGILNFGELIVTMIYRYYDPDFQSHHGRAFGQFSEIPQNETGFFSAIKYRLNRKTLLKSYFDFSREPWRSYFINMPRMSKRYYLQLRHRINRDWTARIQWRMKETEESKVAADTYGHEKKYLIPKLSQNLRLQLDIKLSAHFLLRSRVEKKWTKFNHAILWQNADLPENTGWMIYQQLNFRPWKTLAIYTRLCFFDISDYDSRIYVFENDLPGTLTNRMLMNRGSRWFGLVKYNWSPRIRIAFKFGSDFLDSVSHQNTNNKTAGGTQNNEFAFLVDMFL